MLDPGHGGKDPGAIGIGGTVQDVVLDVSRQVASHLRRKGVVVKMTRSSTPRWICRPGAPIQSLAP